MLREHLCENEHLNWDLNANKSSMGRAEREYIPDILCERIISIVPKKKSMGISTYIYIDGHISPSHSSIYWASAKCQPFYKSWGTE